MKINFSKKLLLVIPVIIGYTESQAQDAIGKKEPGINLNYMDKTIRPNDNFYEFVNGTWIRETEIPNDKTVWGSFHQLRQTTDKDALAILKEASKDPKFSSKTDQGKAINLYLSVMDTIARNKAGINPLKSYLKKIDDVKNSKDLQSLLTEMQPLGGLGFFGVYIGPDQKDSNRNVAEIYAGDVGLPDRDYYVSEDKDSQEKKLKYLNHLTRMFELLGDEPRKAALNANMVLKLETEMAKSHFNRVERRDSRNSYNPMSVAELQKLTPSIDWKKYLKGVGLGKVKEINVSQPKYMATLENIIKSNDVNSWKAYMRWTLFNNSSSYLSTDIETANWEFYEKTLTGALKQRPREEKALQVVNGSIGEALGKLYVEKKFPAEAKVKAEKMIKNVFLAFENRINNLNWMSAETKASAVNKLRKVDIKIGYPDKWKDYSDLTIKNTNDGGSYFENRMNLHRWNFKENIEELKKPVDKSKWSMSPQTVNAYYNPSFNEIVFPAAILQPPFYNYQADEAINYGGIGAVIGHEVSHGFDDSGARYNAEGNLIDWWTAEDLKKFTALTNDLATQYSALQALPGVYVDGNFTLGENIGDLGGVNAAYDGLQLYLKANPNPGLIDGYTPEQRFFISWATIWRNKAREEFLKNQVKTDPHSPAKFRGYVPLQNVDAFYDAFQIKPGDGMYIAPEKRVKIW